jgi:AbrB family looped-hinge helix DNA binding protein
MTTRLSTKGQIVLPKQARTRLQLRPGTKLACKIEGNSIVLTPEQPITHKPKLVREPKTGLIITKSPGHVHVTSQDVQSALVDFP